MRMVHGQELTGRSSVSRGALLLHVKVTRSLTKWKITPAADKIVIMRAGDEVLGSNTRIDSRVFDGLSSAVRCKVLLDHQGLARVKLAGGNCRSPAAEVAAAPQQVSGDVIWLWRCPVVWI